MSEYRWKCCKCTRVVSVPNGLRCHVCEQATPLAKARAAEHAACEELVKCNRYRGTTKERDNIYVRIIAATREVTKETAGE